MSPVAPRIVVRSIANPPTQVVALSGQHDLSSVGDVERALKLAVDSGDAVIVDLRRATFADSAILGVIIKARKQAGRRCFAVVLPSPSQITRLFELVDASSMLLTFDTLRRAVEWCHPLFRSWQLREIRV